MAGPPKPGSWVVKATWDNVEVHVAAGQDATWATKKPPKAWRPGDRLFFWQGRQVCEVQALGELVSISPKKDAEGRTRFKVRYTSGALNYRPCLAQLREDQILSGASFLKSGPAGTVFPLTQEQGDRLSEIIRGGSEVASQAARLKQPLRLHPGTYRVLSLKPQWAWAIIHAGKDVENRSWSTPFRGRILIHASSSKPTGATLEDARRTIARKSGMPLKEVPIDFPLSQIVGSVEVVAIIDNAKSKWAHPGERHWLVRNPLPITEARHRDGKLQLWTLTVRSDD